MRFFRKSRERIEHGHQSVFLEPAITDPGDRGFPSYITNFHELIHQEPFSAQELIDRGFTKIDKSIYIQALNILKHGISYLYHVEIARIYFGDDFLHGVNAIYDERQKCIRYINTDDTEVCIQFMKEMTYYVAKIFREWMKTLHIYIMWSYETFTFQPSTKANDRRYEVDYDARILWV